MALTVTTISYVFRNYINVSSLMLNGLWNVLISYEPLLVGGSTDQIYSKNKLHLGALFPAD